jgi:hypothetical protein
VKKVRKKLSLHKETVAQLQQVYGGARQLDVAGINPMAESGGPDICWFSDCNACEEGMLHAES